MQKRKLLLHELHCSYILSLSPRATELETIRQEVYSLYVVIRNIQELRPSFTIINSEDGQNNEILQPFESYIIPWFGDICSKSCDVIRDAIAVSCYLHNSKILILHIREMLIVTSLCEICYQSICIN